MAQLGSPGVSVSVVDESFYTPSAPGTTPLIIVATAQDKANGSGTGTAQGTLKANAGKVFLLTSQMDLGSLFGTPFFETDANNNPVHAGERNEYGLQAAYSYLGVSSRAYVARADIDLKALEPKADAPTGAPNGGSYWFDTAGSLYGIFEWNGSKLTASSTGAQTFANKTPLLITEATKLSDPTNLSSAPLASLGAVGNYALVTTATPYKLYFKNYKGAWVVVGSNDWTKSWPTVQGGAPLTFTTADSFTITASPAPAQTVTATATTVAGTLTVTATAITNNIITATNTLAAGDIVYFDTALNGFAANTRYYVLAANLTSSGFSVSTSPGGTALTITTTSSISATGTVTSATANMITASGAGNKLTLDEAVVFTGTAFGGLSTGVTYYVARVETNAFAVSTVVGGAPLALTTASGTLTGAAGDSSLIVTGVNTVAGIVSRIGSNLPGVSAEVGIDGQLVIYADGTVNKVSLAEVGGGTLLDNKLGIAPGNFYVPRLEIAPHTSVPSFKEVDTYPRPTGSIWIKSTDANQGASFTLYEYNATSASFVEVRAPIYADHISALKGLDSSSGGLRLAKGQTYVKFNEDEYTFFEKDANVLTAGVRNLPATATFNFYTRQNVGATAVTSFNVGSSVATNVVAFAGTTTYTFDLVESLVSGVYSAPKTISFTTVTASPNNVDLIANAINTGGTSGVAFVNISATTVTVGAFKQLVISHKTGGEIKFKDGSNAPLNVLFNPTPAVPLVNVKYTANLYSAPAGDVTYTFGRGSNWQATSQLAEGVTASINPPSTVTADGTLWYDASLNEVDILVNNGTTWVGYLNYTQNQAGGTTTDPAGPIISATKPTAQSDGTALANGDLWIDSGDLENYPKLYKFSFLTKRWTLVDATDQTTEEGVVFADARWTAVGPSASATSSSIIDLLSSNFVDFDTPDPLLYPKGMLLWNTRRSGFNVKQFKRDYVDVTGRNERQGVGEVQTDYYPHRWVSIAANQSTGAGTFGRKSQRAVVVQALQAMINTNQAIRDEDSIVYNLLACPGYSETVNELVSLNYDRSIASFIIADTPARLKSDATSLSAWGNNTAQAVDNNEQGLVTTDPYVAFYYPWGFSSDNLGNNIVVPPSHMMLRTFALSDNVSYPWFAPAGTRRGGITNASSVGYVDAQTGEFNSVALNTGQRDTLASVHVNPITFIAGSGLVAYGQYTRQLAASSLDRVNVARLIVYLRRQFTQLAKPYVFEPNDTITRNEIKQAAEGLLLELVSQRAIYDYLVVCDTTNNTPARIDRSELYLDVAIEPVKAAEFIYIPLRLENTGAIKGLGQ